MKLAIKPILLCVLLYLVFVVVLMPAKWAVQFIPKNAGVEPSGVSGTIWQGQAQQLMLRGEQIDKVQWQVKPLALLTGQLAADVKFGQGN